MRIVDFMIGFFGLAIGQNHGRAEVKGPISVGASGRLSPKRAWRRALRRGDTDLPRRYPKGTHTAEVRDNAVYLDGRRVTAESTIAVVQSPIWRPDGRALAWVERSLDEARLVVLPDIQPDTLPLMFAIPKAVAREPILFDGPTRIILGTHLLEPRAIASWAESIAAL